MHDYTGNQWRFRNSNKRFTETYGSHTRKTFNSLTTTDSCTRKITHKIWKVLRSETWSPSGGHYRWFLRSTREKKPVTRKKIIIIIIIQYIKRHDRVCAQLHFNICKETEFNWTKTLVWTCAKMSRNKSRRQGNHIVESTSTKWQNYS